MHPLLDYFYQKVPTSPMSDSNTKGEAKALSALVTNAKSLCIWIVVGEPCLNFFSTSLPLSGFY